jgi:hypothetical protein
VARKAKGPEGYGSPGTSLFDRGSPRHMTKTDPSLRGKRTPLPSEPQRQPNKENAQTPETPKGETAKGAQEGYVDSPKDVQCWMRVRAIGRMSPGQSGPQGGRAVSQNPGPTRISWEH